MAGPAEVDRASADRLLARARTTGAKAWLEPFNLSRVDPIAHLVEVGGQRIDGLPMFDGAFTDAAGISGQLEQLERSALDPPERSASLFHLRSRMRRASYGGRAEAQ